MNNTITEQLLQEIETRRDALISLTQDLIRIPTLNPPGVNYREICTFLAERLGTSGFKIELIRAEGAIADSDEYPRWNLVARHEGAQTGECVHFNSH
ncbi:MAG: succinyl-diaminopimelate desuccinylase, partial [Marinosulfonomonas sp.]|nr:succinyl-diaminopimelate desuccinylase [Marinosulfonomonas sp.]